MVPYKIKSAKLPGTRFEELIKEARSVFKVLEKKTKRNPYIRSAYFDKRKVFFDSFWTHLYQKPFKERAKRLKYFKCSLELIKKSMNDPDSKQNPNKIGETLHRFGGLTKNGELFYVQIKEDKKTKRLDLMSIFPG